MRLIIFIFFLTSCVSPSEENCAQNLLKESVDTIKNSSSKTLNKEFDLDWEQQRIETMLKNYSKSIEKIPPTPSHETINALYAQGFKLRNEPVKFMIYVFEDQSYHEEAQSYFKQQTGYDSSKCIMASNGSLFFFGEITSERVGADYILNDLVSVFAGEE